MCYPIHQVKCYIGVGHEREEVACIKVGGYFGETALLYDLPTKVCKPISLR